MVTLFFPKASFVSSIRTIRLDKRCKFIHLSNTIPENLEAFICAHELGHAVCHHDMNTPFLKHHTLFFTDKIEREANRFAVELLLPDSVCYEYEGKTIRMIAAEHGVPYEVVGLKGGDNG